MATFKRILLFLITNIAVVIVLSVVAMLAERFLGIRVTGNLSGGYAGLFIFALVFGFLGSFISLAISRWMAKRAYGIEVMSESRLMDYSSKEQLVYTVVANLAKRNGIDMPEVGVYESDEPNAFATGATKNSALVAVSTGLLDAMTPAEIEGVIGHELSHILNSDMVTMTLLQGVLNTFVIFFSRIIGNFIDRVVFKDEEGNGWGYFLSVIVLEIVFGFLASLVLMAFSRHREYRADEGSARSVGKDKMIQALKRLQYITSRTEFPDDGKLNAFKISSHDGWFALLASHPSLEDRIAALEGRYDI